tara:strand:- start:34 stop:2073 length:2040 start_codon:yes stop_codon:yes gene_type:complete
LGIPLKRGYQKEASLLRLFYLLNFNMPIERKLAAIMFTDIAGYTASMSKSESKSLELLEKKRTILKPLLKEYNGTFVKEIGDGTLSYFESAVSAATCAVKLQEQTYNDKDINIRAGIHIGDIVFKDGDVFGDGVNVASRLESIAPKGGVCVSKNVYDELLNQDDFDGVELGLQSLKGVGRLVEVFGLKGEKLNEPNPDKYQDNKVAIHSDDEVPSIAIIPFKNKGAEEDVFYAYGISADLISDCSGAGLIRVASLSNIEKIESYESLQAEDLASKLDVRYTAEGTLWKMGDMFQLSVELYDTKDKKVVWSDRWQEKWDNLTTIKSNLSDGLLKALDTTSKVEKKAETTNTKAYELYLKAKHTYDKRTDINDTEKARKLLRQAIELDDTLIAAKLALGISYNETGDNDEAMEIFASALEQAEKLGDKKGMAITLNSIGIMNAIRGEYDTALECYERSLKIKEELGDKAGMAAPLGNIGNLHFYRGEYDTALEYHDRSLKVEQEIGDKSSMGQTLMNIGYVNNYKGEYDTALEYYDRSLKIQEEIGRMHSVALSLCNIGIVHANRYEHDKAVESLEKSLAIQKEIGLKEIELLTTIYLYLSYKHLGKDYDEQDIHSLIKDAEYYDEINFRLYQLLDDTSYLKKAYTQVQEIASEMEEDLGKTFLSYPIPKAIIEEWGKINN